MFDEFIENCESCKIVYGRSTDRNPDYQRGWNDCVSECINVLKIEYPLHAKNIEKILKDMVKK